jgi:hypothetical protein
MSLGKRRDRWQQPETKHLFHEALDKIRQWPHLQLSVFAFSQGCVGHSWEQYLHSSRCLVSFLPPSAGSRAWLEIPKTFEDSQKKTRHLVRLWLKNELFAWKLPEALQGGNDKVFYNIETDERWEIIPPHRLGFDIREKFGP